MEQETTSTNNDDQPSQAELGSTAVIPEVSEQPSASTAPSEKPETISPSPENKLFNRLLFPG